LQRRFYRPELDIVRLLAFLSVFFFHAGYADWHLHGKATRILEGEGRFGLCLFFTLSAYLITTLLLREMQTTGTIAIARFYQRRILRIWPLYLSAIALSCAWSLHHHNFHIQRHWYIAALLLVGNHNRPGDLAIGHLWSISIEEQFYVVWPSLVKRLKVRHLSVAALGLILGANGMIIFDGFAPAGSHVNTWYNTLVQFEMFAAGVLLAIVTFGESSWLTSRLVRSCLVIALPITWFCAEYCFTVGSLNHPLRLGLTQCVGYALVAVSCPLFIYALLGTSGWPKWLVHLGKVSYGLYVFHLPALTVVEHATHFQSPWLAALLALALTSALALLSYRFFETPFLKMKQHLEVIPSRPVEID